MTLTTTVLVIDELTPMRRVIKSAVGFTTKQQKMTRRFYQAAPIRIQMELEILAEFDQAVWTLRFLR